MIPFVMNQKTRDRNKITGNIIKSVKDNPTHYSIRISIHAPVKGATWSATMANSFVS